MSNRGKQRRWTQEETSHMVMLDAAGYSARAIGTKLQRTEHAITIRLSQIRTGRIKAVTKVLKGEDISHSYLVKPTIETRILWGLFTRIKFEPLTGDE